MLWERDASIMKMYTVNYIDRNGNGQIVRVMADSKEHAKNRAKFRGAVEVSSVEITPPADKIQPH